MSSVDIRPPTKTITRVQMLHISPVSADDMTIDKCPGLIGHEFVDRLARSDVDAGRWLAQGQHSRISRQAAGNQHLLLVSAAQRADRVILGVGLDLHYSSPTGDDLALASPGKPPEAPEPVQDRDRQVLADAHLGEEALAGAVGRYDRDVEPPGIADVGPGPGAELYLTHTVDFGADQDVGQLGAA